MSPELSESLIRTCARATGLTMNEVIQIAGIGPKRYKVYQIPKRSGGYRTICHPSRELKALQYVFLREILNELPVHEAATAYKAGSSIKENASRHLASRVILKLDFQRFFPSIKVNDWAKYAKARFPEWTTQDLNFSANVMFWGAGGYRPVCLSIGAPTSPLISNALMYQFDELMSKYALEKHIEYTRYADDITFSSNDFLEKKSVIAHVQKIIDSMEYPTLKLNVAKTKLASKSTSRRVTGLVLTNEGQLSIGRDRKRLISAMVHHALNGRSDGSTLAHLAGLLSFASDVEPEFITSLHLKYGKNNIEGLQFRGVPQP